MNTYEENVGTGTVVDAGDDALFESATEIDFDSMETDSAEEFASADTSRALPEGNYVLMLTLLDPVHPKDLKGTTEERIKRSSYYMEMRQNKPPILHLAQKVVQVEVLYNIDEDSPMAWKFQARYGIINKTDNKSGKAGEINTISRQQYAALCQAAYREANGLTEKEVKEKVKAGTITTPMLEGTLNEFVCAAKLSYRENEQVGEDGEPTGRVFESNDIIASTVTLLPPDMVAAITAG